MPVASPGSLLGRLIGRVCTQEATHPGSIGRDTGGAGPGNPGGRPSTPVAFADVSLIRRCSRTACGKTAVATLTYVYAESTAVLGPLAMYAEPHCYDLCQAHSERLTAPRGWEVVRLAPDPDSLQPNTDDLEALADAVRESARPAARMASAPVGPPVHELGRRGHLRILRPVED